jgi:hypothetical protein
MGSGASKEYWGTNEGSKKEKTEFRENGKATKYEEFLKGKQADVRALFHSLQPWEDAVLSLAGFAKMLEKAGVPGADKAHLNAWYEGLSDKPGHGGLDERTFGCYLAEVALHAAEAERKFREILEKAKGLEMEGDALKENADPATLALQNAGGKLFDCDVGEMVSCVERRVKELREAEAVPLSLEEYAEAVLMELLAAVKRVEERKPCCETSQWLHDLPATFEALARDLTLEGVPVDTNILQAHMIDLKFGRIARIILTESSEQCGGMRASGSIAVPHLVA